MADKIRVKIAEFKLARDGEILACYGLGSCVGISLYDRAAKVGGLAHILLPLNQGKDDNPLKYADTCIDAMLKELVTNGASEDKIAAKIAGGADMFPNSPFDKKNPVGQRNINAVREKLESIGISLEAEEIGGHSGRTIEFDLTTGKLTVKVAFGEHVTI